MFKLLTDDSKLIFAANEAIKELADGKKLCGEYAVEKIENGLYVKKSENENKIGYSDIRSFMRAISIISQHSNEKEFFIKETPKYNLLGAMPDASRNAVPKIDTLKKFCRILALEGYNALLLYTEDTYEIKNRPYFGHLRGRYTHQELKELDDYAYSIGIEVIPAIQTLAHLNGMFEWPAFYELQDCNDIMEVGSEKVYAMIDDMLSAVKSTFRTNKINIGLDEARMLGSGRYLENNGYKERYMIMSDHLKRVKELCMKHGYQPRMWSDMFFRMLNRGVYKVKGTQIPKEVADSVPPELILVYWDYVQPNVENYDEMFRQHTAFKNSIAFAGGDSSWYGLVPLNVLGKRCAMSATESIKNNGTDEVYVTMWGDDGASCSLFTTLHSLFIYGEACWSDHEKREENAIARLKACAGVDEKLLLDIGRVNDVPSRTKFGKKDVNPTKYMFYNNILTGKFDANVPDGTNDHMKAISATLKAHDKNEYSYAVETIIALCDVLAVKAELGKRIHKAYHNNDKTEILSICEKDIPDAISLAYEFKEKLFYQWNKENKSFGFDVLDMRIGGMISQTETAKKRLLEWVNNGTEIDELNEPRLPYHVTADKCDESVIQLNRWERMAGQNISNMFGYA